MHPGSTKKWGLAVRAIVLDETRRMLLLRRSLQDRHFSGQWEWPGGKVGPGENFEEALVRELLEETGLRVEVLKLAGASQSDMRDVRVVTLFMEVHVAGGTLVISDEHEECRWVAPSDLADIELASNSRDFMLCYARSASPS